MARLTEEMVIARSKQSDLSAVKKLNCWGAELGDVTLLRRMPNVEVLALSINKIRSLDAFTNCRRLRELYVRKNEIRELSEIRHLRHLPDLTSLWLDENPCTQHPQYRMTVLRNLPNLEKLDNVSVQPEEVQEAMRRGVHIPDSDDEGYPQQQETYSQYRTQRSCDSSPEREPDQFYRKHEQGSDSSEGAGEPPPDSARSETHQQCVGAPSVPEPDERYEHPAMTRSHYEARTPRSPDDAALRHSLSAQSVKEYTYSTNGECRYGEARGVTSPHTYHEPYYDRSDRSDYQQVPQRCAVETWEREKEREVPRDRDRESVKEYPSAVMAEHRGFTRRPVTRNSNLLSAVLCLVKELDYPSLEVAEMAVRSSSSLTSGGSGARGPDIIDLDAYMRGAAHRRPTDRDPHDRDRDNKNTRSRLVVDNGGPRHRRDPPRVSGPPAVNVSRPHQSKRFSHDSGLSDSSCRRRNKQRVHRRSSNHTGGNGDASTSHDPPASVPCVPHSAKSSNSMKALQNFQSVLEKSIMNQQEQITKVAELCERLTSTTKCDRSKPKPKPKSSGSGSVSSSTECSKSIRNPTKKYMIKGRTFEMIMNKIEQLNRVLVTRGPSPPPRTMRLHSGRSSDTDLSVGAEVSRRKSRSDSWHKSVPPSMNMPKLIMVEKGVGGSAIQSEEEKKKVTKIANLEAIPTQVCDITPKDAPKRDSHYKIHVESVVRKSGCERSTTSSVEHSRVDLNNPPRLHELSKRMQMLEMSASTLKNPRGSGDSIRRSASHSAHNSGHNSARLSALDSQRGSKSSEKTRSRSLCGLCRGYVRCVSHYIAAQIFCCPDRP